MTQICGVGGGYRRGMCPFLHKLRHFDEPSIVIEWAFELCLFGSRLPDSSKQMKLTGGCGEP